MNKGFTPRMIGLIEQALRHRAALIVDNVIEHGTADFVEDIAAELPLQAIAEIMGVPQEDRHLLFQWSNAMIGADDPEFEGGVEGAHEASAALYAYANELAKKRRSDPRDDIVTRLINAEVDGERHPDWPSAHDDDLISMIHSVFPCRAPSPPRSRPLL